MANPKLGEALAGLEAATAKLGVAEQGQVAARTQVLTLDIVRAQQVDAVELASAHSEVAILTKQPGRKDLVRALLAPARKEGKGQEEAVVEAKP